MLWCLAKLGVISGQAGAVVFQQACLLRSCCLRRRAAILCQLAGSGCAL